MIIDMEHSINFSTEEQRRSIGSSSDKTERRLVDGRVVYRLRHASVEDHLEFMDKAGVDMAVLTGGKGGELDEIKSWTDACAKVVKQYPKRFAALAPARPLGGKPAFDEMERAIKKLGMKGFHITCRPQGQYLDSRELWPFYEKVSELEVPIDVHILFSDSGDAFDAVRADYALAYVMLREYDISAATLRICLGGVLEKFPNLVFICNHFGGGVSAVMERIDLYMELMGDNFYPGKPLISKPWREYFNKLYFNMAGRGVGMAAVKSALTTTSPKKMMFALDWPQNYDGNPQGVRRYVEEIRKLDLPKGDIEGMLGGNAAKVLKI